jgi:hypothetical protein
MATRTKKETITMNTLHPQTSTQEAATELDELYGRYMAAVNMGGGEQYGEQSLAAQWAWEEYQAAMIYRTYERVMVVKTEVAA